MLNIANHQLSSNEKTLHTVRTTIIKNTTQRTRIVKYMEKREALFTVDGTALMQTLWKTVWKFLKKLKVELLCDPTISFLGFFLKKTKDTCMSMFTLGFFTIAKIGTQPKCSPTDKWVKNMQYILSWPKKFIHKMLQKNLNKIFGQPNAYPVKYYSVIKKEYCHVQQNWCI